MRRYAMILAAGLTLASCARDEGSNAGATTAAAQTPAAPAVPNDVRIAAAVRRGIDAAPDKADSVLSANGLTAAGFDSLMYRIAADSSLRAAFASAR
ncbi:MAG: hypothetical protein ACRENU_08715 [Gemmatimonadaceae bacterium]